MYGIIDNSVLAVLNNRHNISDGDTKSGPDDNNEMSDGDTVPSWNTNMSTFTSTYIRTRRRLEGQLDFKQLEDCHGTFHKKESVAVSAPRHCTTFKLRGHDIIFNIKKEDQSFKFLGLEPFFNKIYNNDDIVGSAQMMRLEDSLSKYSKSN